MTARPSVLLSCCILVCAGCTSVPQDALRLSKTSLADRQMQSRRFKTTDEAKILSACAGLMQDLGFNLDESEPELGVVVGSKNRSARSGSNFLSCLAINVMSYGWANKQPDERQKMRCCIVTTPYGNSHILVRVTFQRIVWDVEGNCTRREAVKIPEAYQEFFDRLAKSVFLGGQSL